MNFTRDLADRIRTNYPAATVTYDEDSLKVDALGSHILTQGRADGTVGVFWSVTGFAYLTPEVLSPTDAAARVMELLGEAWRAQERPRTVPASASSSYGEGDVDAIGYETGHDPDGGDE